jgi:hypothetical protein
MRDRSDHFEMNPIRHRIHPSREIRKISRPSSRPRAGHSARVEAKERARRKSGADGRGTEDSGGVIDASSITAMIGMPGDRSTLPDPRIPRSTMPGVSPAGYRELPRHNGIYMVSHRDPFSALGLYTHIIHTLRLVGM